MPKSSAERRLDNWLIGFRNRTDTAAKVAVFTVGVFAAGIVFAALLQTWAFNTGRGILWVIPY